MKSKKTMSENEFMQLSKIEQAKELKKLTKRANVRLSLLEEKDSINLAYRQAYQYNMSQDRESNRFYEGTNYKSSSDIKNAFKSVSNFLENKASTLKGVSENVKEAIQPMLDKIFVKDGQYIDRRVIDKMNPQEKRYASKLLAQATNKKLAELEKNDIKQYAYEMAQHYNEKVMKRSKNRFFRGLNFKNDNDVEAQLDEMIHFYNAKTSTVAGYEESITNRLNSFREKGVEIPKDKEAEKQFFDFLSSAEFKNYIKDLDSEQVVSTFIEARNIRKTVVEINEKYKLYRDGIITGDVVRTQLGLPHWQPKQENTQEIIKKAKHKFKPRKK